jgi:hypothetical protein
MLHVLSTVRTLYPVLPSLLCVKGAAFTVYCENPVLPSLLCVKLLVLSTVRTLCPVLPSLLCVKLRVLSFFFCENPVPCPA